MFEKWKESIRDEILASAEKAARRVVKDELNRERWEEFRIMQKDLKKGEVQNALEHMVYKEMNKYGALYFDNMPLKTLVKIVEHLRKVQL